MFYSAGFATAIYCFAPVPSEGVFNQDGVNISAMSDFAASDAKMDMVVRIFNGLMHKAVGVVKDAGFRMLVEFKAKLNERPPPGG